MTTLTITRGLPGSGKTTLAREWVAADPAHRARLNRDDFGAMMHAGWFHHGPDELRTATEDAITAAQHAAVRALLDAGLDVIVDDTNLRDDVFTGLRDVADAVGAGFETVDLMHLPLDVVLERNARRDGDRYVPEPVIRDMWERYGGSTADRADVAR